MTLQFRTLLCVMDVLWLQGCALSEKNYGSIDWNTINYAKLACGKGNADNPGCKSNESVASVGYGKGK